MQITNYDEVPADMRATAEEWHASASGAMRSFARGRPANLQSLLRETRSALARNDGDARWEQRLRDLEAFAVARIRALRAERNLQFAMKEAALAGLRRQDAERWLADAFAPAPRRAPAKD